MVRYGVFVSFLTVNGSLLGLCCLPKARAGRPRADDRKTINGILYMLITGCRRMDMPARYTDGAWPLSFYRDNLLPFSDIAAISFLHLGQLGM